MAKDDKIFLLQVLRELDIGKHLEHKPQSIKDCEFFWANNKAHVLQIKFKYSQTTFGIVVTDDEKTGTILSLVVGDRPHTVNSVIASVNLADPTAISRMRSEILRKLKLLLEDKLLSSIPKELLIKLVPEYKEWTRKNIDHTTVINKKTIKVYDVFAVYEELI